MEIEEEARKRRLCELNVSLVQTRLFGVWEGGWGRSSWGHEQ